MAEGERVDALHRRIHSTYAVRGESRTNHRNWSAACRAYHEDRTFFDIFRTRAFLDKVIAEDGDERETAFTFLEADPWCYWSGYTKEKLIRALKQADLDAKQLDRIRWVLLRAVKGRRRPELREFCRLAIRIADENVYAQLQELAEDPTQSTQRNARAVLEYLHRHRPAEFPPACK